MYYCHYDCDSYGAQEQCELLCSIIYTGLDVTRNCNFAESGCSIIIIPNTVTLKNRLMCRIAATLIFRKEHPSRLSFQIRNGIIGNVKLYYHSLKKKTFMVQSI